MPWCCTAVATPGRGSPADRTPPAGAGSRRSAAPAPAGRRWRATAVRARRALREPAADGRIVGRGARVGLGRQRLAQRQAGGAAVLGHLGEDLCVVLRIDHDRDGRVVLGGGADHGGAADVDVLDALVVGRALGRGGLERIEIDHQQVDGRDAVRAAARACSALPRMASRPPWTLGCSVLRRPSIISGKPVCAATSLTATPAPSAPGPCRRSTGSRRRARQRAGKLDEAGLVGDRDQGPLDFGRCRAAVSVMGMPLVGDVEQDRVPIEAVEWKQGTCVVLRN